MAATYKIQSGPASARRFPGTVTTLSLSWFQGRIEAVAIHRGEPAGTWTCPDVTEDPARFGDIVKTAIRQTGYTGATVSMVLAHARLAQQLIETPPARGQALENALERQIERMKVFEGEAAWSHEPAGESRNTQNTLLHLLPKSIVDQLVASTERTGLHLVSLVPPTTVLRTQLNGLGLTGNEVALLAAQTGDLLTIVVGRRDGTVLLGRSLDPSRFSGAGGLSLELNRTLLFVNQQFGVPVSSIWIFGTGAEERAAELAPQLPIPVRVSSEAPRAFYWAEENAVLGTTNIPNLISSEQRNAPKRQALLRFTTVVTLALLIIATGVFGVMGFLSAREQSTIRRREQQIAALQEQHRQLQAAQSALSRKEEAIKSVLDGRPAPVPGWFLAYLGQEVPAEMRLTDASIRRDGDLWHVRLGGVAQPSAQPRPNSSLSNAVATLTERLQTGPFRLKVSSRTTSATPSDRQAIVPTGPVPAQTLTSVNTVANWTSRRMPIPTPNSIPAPVLRDRFMLEGWMK